MKFNNSTKTYPNLINFSLFDAPYDDRESSTTKNIKFGCVSIELLYFEFEINILNQIRPKFNSIELNQASIQFKFNSIWAQFKFKNPQFDSIRMTLNSIRFELIRFVWKHYSRLNWLNSILLKYKQVIETVKEYSFPSEYLPMGCN